jgi:hypothetical protein
MFGGGSIDPEPEGPPCPLDTLGARLLPPVPGAGPGPDPGISPDFLFLTPTAGYPARRLPAGTGAALFSRSLLLGPSLARLVGGRESVTDMGMVLVEGVLGPPADCGGWV